ncbi:MAG: diol dehydratase small subunit [Gaiellales bacterium]
MDAERALEYPLGSCSPELVTTPGGRAFAEVTLQAARDGRLDASELRATSATLELQSRIARGAGRAPLGESLLRASELVDVPDEELLAIYTALRPGRSTAAELEAAAASLDGYGAVQCASFVREAAAVYAERGLLYG